MNVYKIESDFNYKDVTGVNQEIIGHFFEYKGNSIGANWELPIFAKVEDISNVKSEVKSQHSKFNGFDARCYGNIFLLNVKISNHFSNLPVELLPVKIQNYGSNFVFVNVLNVIESINFSEMDFNRSMEMVRNKQIQFTYDIVRDEILFRDKKLVNNYYCTDKFVDLITENRITGLQFDKVGEAK